MIGVGAVYAYCVQPVCLVYAADQIMTFNTARPDTVTRRFDREAEGQLLRRDGATQWLTQAEKKFIFLAMHGGWPLTNIAKKIHRHEATIYRYRVRLRLERGARGR